MDIRQKELIAIGASVTAHCVPCLRYHVQKAREVGVADEEIHDAVEVGRMVRKGAGLAWDAEAATVLGGEAPDARAGRTAQNSCC